MESITSSVVTSSNDLVFFLNGDKVVISNPDPEMSLLTYLRSQNVGLTGTKLGCGEGGCGACTVMLSHYSFSDKHIDHRSVNACLFPLCAVAGCAITTVEGLGNVRDGLHPVQSRMADANGSQCGFCTPGIIMALYAYLRSHPNATQHDIEESFDGNLCRCTGYRPILDAANLELQIEHMNKEFQRLQHYQLIKHNKIKMVSVLQQVNHVIAKRIPSQPLDLKSELIFPPFLMDYQIPSLKFQGSRTVWHTPTSFDEILQIKRNNPTCKIVVGNTEVGIETKFRNVVYPVLVCPTKVPEMNGIVEHAEHIEIGASVTLTHIKQHLEKVCAREPLDKSAERCQVFRAMLSQFRWFAGNQIRNAACLGGNIITASPISDINPVLMAAGAQLELVRVDQDGKRHVRTVPIATFFKSYRVVDIAADEVLRAIIVPFTKPLEFVQAYKQSRRRDDDIAIVSCCFRVQLEKSGEEHRVKDCSLAYGGMSVKAVLATRTMEFLKGKVWSRSLLDETYSMIAADLPLAQGAPGGMIEYRRSLTTSFFFKYFLLISSFIAGDIDAREASAFQPYTRELSHGEQTYQTRPAMHPISEPVKHQSADKQVTGEAVYIDDIKLTSLYSAMVMSTKAHARIVSIDASRALAMTGVKKFLTAKDIRGENQIGPIFHDEELLASEEVVCQGFPIGVIIADTHQRALEGARAVVVQYEELPAVLTIDDAIAQNSFFATPHIIADGGDVEQALAGAEHRIEGEFRMGGQEHFYLETNATLAVPGEGDEITIYASTQNPSKTQYKVASVLGVHANQVVVKLKRMGGGFGGKETRSIFVSALAALAAQHMRQPVRMVLDRDTDMIITGTRHPFLGRYRIGFDGTGKIQAADVKLYADAGYSIELSYGVLDRALFHSENAYKVPCAKFTGYLCKTNLPTNTAFRGFGGPQGMMICEDWIEKISTYLSIPSYQIREKNFYKEGMKTHYLQDVTNCQLDRIWKETTVKSDYFNRLTKTNEYNAKNKYRKRGIAIIPTKFGMSFTIKTLNQAGALVHVYTDGSVLVTHGGCEMGQGLNTKIIQIAARELGVPVDKVYINDTATDKVANTTPTAASVSSDTNGMAVLDACQQINSRLAPIRARLAPTATFAQVTQAAFVDRVNLSANGFYATPNVGYDFQPSGVGKGVPFNYFNYGCACAEVEVDTLTGDYTTLRADVIMDVGDSLNPAIDIGQVEGAFTQGFGLTTMEEIVTFTPSGYQFTRGPSTYKIPGFNDVPIIFNVSLLSDAPNPKAIHSSKGVGEPPLFLGSSVYFAIREAIKSARTEQQQHLNGASINNNNNNHNDNRLKDWFELRSPATCERIRNACMDLHTSMAAEKPKVSN
uniref:xanthine dehydrogenase n=1 Tax=Cavenderia deminutiva TaxID=361123 RepID=A0A1L2FUV5_9MYCE|nr:xanthine dehydrogenase [Cavenderia deminutiva]